MAQEPMGSVVDELEQVRRRFEEFRKGRPSRGRLPEGLWKEAVALAQRYGLNPTAQALGLDYSRLKKRLPATSSGRVTRQKKEDPPTFVELIGNRSGMLTECQVEVESGHGAKLRLEPRGIGAAELASLIRAFVGQ